MRRGLIKRLIKWTGIKKCSKCKRFKRTSDFPIAHSTFPRGDCRSCHNEASKEYARNHQEQMRQWKRDNSDKVREYRRKSLLKKRNGRKSPTQRIKEIIWQETK